MGQSHVTIHDKVFRPYLPAAALDEAVSALAARLSTDYAGREPLFVVVLTGAFMFASDLLKRMTEPCEVVFIRVASYEGTGSTGVVQEVLGLREDVKDRHLIIVEDIVDTGLTMNYLKANLKARKPKSLTTVALLEKPDALKVPCEINMSGFKIPNDFVVGYGLDYQGYYRNLPYIAQVQNLQ